MSGITTHILDTARGLPAAGLRLRLELGTARGEWVAVSSGVSDAGGRASLLDSTPNEGTYRLTFDTGAYFEANGVNGFYPEVQVMFVVRDAQVHHHVPLLLSPFGYSTYRGS
ncbi:MAG: hydroxyisourate hydrolase [Acidobacteriota bacterium]